MSSPSPEQPWTLTREALDKLLASLDPDRRRAAEEYETIRQKLIHYFTWRGISHPDEHADEVINRVSRRIEEGEEIRDVRRYFYGVARFRLLEVSRQAGTENVLSSHVETAADPAQVEQDDDSEDHGIRLRCFQGCVRQLGAGERDLIVRYYRTDTSDRIEGRKELARQLAVTIEALRNRAHRLRVNLENCVRRCQQDSTDLSPTNADDRRKTTWIGQAGHIVSRRLNRWIRPARP